MKIHTYVTSEGMIFINFDTSPNPVPFEEHFGHLAAEWGGHDFSVYEYVQFYSLDSHNEPLRRPFFTRVIVGNFNWKTMMDGYQECYHCRFAASLRVSGCF